MSQTLDHPHVRNRNRRDCDPILLLFRARVPEAILVLHTPEVMANTVASLGLHPPTSHTQRVSYLFDFVQSVVIGVNNKDLWGFPPNKLRRLMDTLWQDLEPPEKARWDELTGLVHQVDDLDGPSYYNHVVDTVAKLSPAPLYKGHEKQRNNALRLPSSNLISAGQAVSPLSTTETQTGLDDSLQWLNAFCGGHGTQMDHTPRSPSSNLLSAGQAVSPLSTTETQTGLDDSLQWLNALCGGHGTQMDHAPRSPSSNLLSVGQPVSPLSIQTGMETQIGLDDSLQWLDAFCGGHGTQMDHAPRSPSSNLLSAGQAVSPLSVTETQTGLEVQTGLNDILQWLNANPIDDQEAGGFESLYGAQSTVDGPQSTGAMHFFFWPEVMHHSSGEAQSTTYMTPSEPWTNPALVPPMLSGSASSGSSTILSPGQPRHVQERCYKCGSDTSWDPNYF